MPLPFLTASFFLSLFGDCSSSLRSWVSPFFVVVKNLLSLPPGPLALLFAISPAVSGSGSYGSVVGQRSQPQIGQKVCWCYRSDLSSRIGAAAGVAFIIPNL